MLFADFDWVTAVKDVGFPVVAYGAFAAAIWATLKWVAANVVIPMRDGLLTFLGALHANVDKMSDNLETQTDTLRDMNEANSEIKAAIQTIASRGCGGHQNGRQM